MVWPTDPSSYARGTIVDPTSGSETSLGIIHSERQEIEFGLWNTGVLGLSTAGAVQAAPWGKVRELIIEGHVTGTMEDLETFIWGIEIWMNVSLALPDKKWYFPFLHGQAKDYKVSPLVLSGLTWTEVTGDTPSTSYSNAFSSSNLQRYKYDVLVDTFAFEYDEGYPNRVDYIIVLREANAFDGFTSTTPES